MLIVMFAAVGLTALFVLLTRALLGALLFIIRLYFISLFIAKAADTQVLHAPITITRCLIYGNAVFERWRQFRANGYSVEGIEWAPDALEATVPKVQGGPPVPMPPPWPPLPRPSSGHRVTTSNTVSVPPVSCLPLELPSLGRKAMRFEQDDLTLSRGPLTGSSDRPVSLRQQELDEDLRR
jgi:hypothetical protein